MPATILVILGGVGVLALGLLLIRVGRQIAIGLMVLGGIVAVIALAVAMLGQADATRQTAKATQRVAEAAVTASRGQSISSAVNSALVVLLVLVLVAALAAGGYFFMRWRTLERMVARGYPGRRASGASSRGRRWASGPNAYWERGEPRQALPDRPPIVVCREPPPSPSPRSGSPAPVGEAEHDAFGFLWDDDLWY